MSKTRMAQDDPFSLFSQDTKSKEATKIMPFVMISVILMLILLPVTLYTMTSSSDAATLSNMTSSVGHQQPSAVFERFRLAATAKRHLKNSLMEEVWSKITAKDHGFVIKRSATEANDTRHEEVCKESETCEQCVSWEKYQCLWCSKGNRCMAYPTAHVWPTHDDCEWIDARWAVCWLDFRAMVIALSVIGGILLLIFCCCAVKLCRCIRDCCEMIFCCCCGHCERDRNSKKADRSMRRLERELQRQAKRQELMLKYSVNRMPTLAYGGAATSDYKQFENS